ERAAEHSHPLADAHHSQAAALGCARERVSDLEAGAVVADPHVDRAAPRAEPDLHLRSTGVLTDVGERFLHCPEQRHPLRGAEGLGIAADLETGVDAAPLGEGIDLTVEDLTQRAADDAPRFERVRNLAEPSVELSEAGSQVVEA